MALARKNRLQERQVLDRVFKEGRTVRGSFLLVKFLKNSQEYPRFSISVPAKVFKSAVNRNRTRRVISENLKTFLTGIKGTDFLIIVHKKIKEEEMIAELAKIFNKLNG